MKIKQILATIICFCVVLILASPVRAEDIGCKFCYANPGGCQNGVAFCAHSCYPWAGFTECSADDCQGPGSERCGGGPRPTATPTPPTVTPTPTPTGGVPTPTPTPPAGGPTPTPTPPPPPATNSWFQTVDGDVHANDEILPQLPDAADFSLASTNGASGIISYGHNFDRRAGRASADGWLVKSTYAGRRYDYSYFDTNLEPDQSFVGDQRLSGLNLPSGRIFKIDADLIVDSDLAADLGVKVFLVSGRVQIETDLQSADSLAVFISNGDIEVAPDVHQIKAVLISSGRVKTGKVTEDETLVIQGYSVSWDDFRLERERQDNNLPAEKFIFDPEIFFQLAPVLGKPRYTWIEVVP